MIGRSEFAWGFCSWRVRLIENCTASAVTGLPSWNFAVSVRWRVHSFPSGDASYLVQRQGSIGWGQPPS